jgi:predicted DNA binding CopG/RHH family protein
MSEQLPNFESEDEEREFWAERDSVDYVDWSRARRVVLPNLKPSTRSISLRLPEMMLDELKLLANRRDVPYQSLIKVFLAERIDQELRGPFRRPAGGGLRMLRERPRRDDPAKGS